MVHNVYGRYGFFTPYNEDIVSLINERRNIMIETNRKFRNSSYETAAAHLKEFLWYGNVRTSDKEDANEIFCRMLDAVNIKYDVVKEDGVEYFTLRA